jgi:hypothetical protein
MPNEMIIPLTHHSPPYTPSILFNVVRNDKHGQVCRSNAGHECQTIDTKCTVKDPAGRPPVSHHRWPSCADKSPACSLPHSRRGSTGSDVGGVGWKHCVAPGRVALDCVYPFIVRSETSSLDIVGARRVSWPSVSVRMAR